MSVASVPRPRATSLAGSSPGESIPYCPGERKPYSKQRYGSKAQLLDAAMAGGRVASRSCAGAPVLGSCSELRGAETSTPGESSLELVGPAASCLHRAAGAMAKQ